MSIASVQSVRNAQQGSTIRAPQQANDADGDEVAGADPAVDPATGETDAPMSEGKSLNLLA